MPFIYVVIIIPLPRNEVRGILESPCPSICLSVDARAVLGKMISGA